MKKVLFLIFASLFVLGACGQDSDKSNKDDNNKSESKSVKKSNDPKKDKKSDDKKVDSKDEKQSESKNNSDDTTNNESESTSKNDNGKSQSNNGNNERTQGKQATQQQSNNQQAQNNNGYMSQAEIDEWNRTKPTTHDESQMGYGRSEYEQARKASEKVWDNPNAHVGGPSWVGKNEGYDSWANRQKEVAEMQSE
ncbi:hypothetical protein ACRS8G_12230 [Staphylococcus epidermidis]|uniref:hypothetical protein n=1 Tax=Staphylococcus TaxID=1279 RepID=UPI0008A9EC18|nr:MULTISPECIES: hypothetical protein [Staphylococcus]MCG1401556.1 hypothetical protein [Staphylococcus epidermidis]MCG1935847.1 hypothetical protein [Staphylococcus epidermidis]MCG1937957.1 hypothetical protein [Staphylococcus epidermidis]MCG1942513.1 hypothetical protein [Staphylococcus epidermidis]MCG1951511.1 hypothetical protein [Staphylococcus epidermidis]